MLVNANQGFNCPYLIETFKGVSISTQLINYLETLKTSRILTHIRLPGGTISQDYSPKTGGGNWVFKNGLPLQSYIPLIKKINVPVIWVANLLWEDTVGDTLYAINLLEANGIKVIGIELGNELFAFDNRHGISYFLNFFDTTDKFKLNNLLDDMKTHIDELVNRYPHIKLSLRYSLLSLYSFNSFSISFLF